MFLNRKAQSTAEYAIIIGLVVAIAAGVLQVALKGGIRQKNKQAVNYLLGAGNDTPDFSSVQDQGEKLFGSEYRATQVLVDDYADVTILDQGGAEKKLQKQKTETEAVSVELIDEMTQ